MWTEQKLYNLLTEPSGALVEDMKRIKGDILVLGAGGKMGPTLCVLAKRALEKAGSSSRIIAVSRFSGAQERRFLKENGVDIIQADLLDAAQRAGLPQVENVIYMAGRKFETVNQEWETWAMNASLSGFIAEQYKESRIVVFSSGNVYPLCSVQAAGCSEEVPPQPIGEYAMSCLARERALNLPPTDTVRVSLFTVSVLRWICVMVFFTTLPTAFLRVNRFQSATRASTVFGRATPMKSHSAPCIMRLLRLQQ